MDVYINAEITNYFYKSSTWLHVAAPSFSKDPYSFYVALYPLQFYGLKNFITVIVYIIAVSLEQFEIHVFSRYYRFLYVFRDQLETFVTPQLWSECSPLLIRDSRYLAICRCLVISWLITLSFYFRLSSINHW